MIIRASRETHTHTQKRRDNRERFFFEGGRGGP